MSSSAWSGRRVLVTGHTGFKGAWLSYWLRELGASVTGYALSPPTTPSLFDLAGLADSVDDRRGDLLDAELLAKVVAEVRPEVVFHLAAQSLVRASYREPAQTFATNVVGTCHLLDAVRSVGGVKGVVVVTSDKCYENEGAGRPFIEEDPLGGHDPYSASKGAAELVVSSYRKSFFSETETLVASARAGNVIGGGDFALDRLVPDLMRSFSAGVATQIRNPLATRPFQHVLEPLSGYLTLAERLLEGEREAGRAFNFGPDEVDVWSVERLADAAASLWGDGASWTTDPGAHPHEARALSLSSARARAQLGYRPRTTLQEGLAWTVEFHRALHLGRAARELMRGDILRFTHLRDGAVAASPG